ncbi:Hypothetical predicted protein [Cloeon dipterum]|uniref:Uncharacterized protein n=1 Tax=Cloeon dipterum TaxID=197152 RepID=A0A8S1CXM0_9INSE|nr:Hypothetical predicted protein [Cloeon dipterum]
MPLTGETLGVEIKSDFKKDTKPTHVVVAANSPSVTSRPYFLSDAAKLFGCPFLPSPLSFSFDIMIRVRPLASLLANPNPQQVQENQEGNQDPLEILQQQAAEADKIMQRRVEIVRRMRRRFNPYQRPPADRADRPPPNNENSEEHEFAFRKFILQALQQPILPPRICGRLYVGPAPRVIMPESEDDEFF